jgi:hypothetical protein
MTSLRNIEKPKFIPILPEDYPDRRMAGGAGRRNTVPQFRLRFYWLKWREAEPGIGIAYRAAAPYKMTLSQSCS